jgi:hypothetical protein
VTSSPPLVMTVKPLAMIAVSSAAGLEIVSRSRVTRLSGARVRDKCRRDLRASKQDDIVSQRPKQRTMWEKTHGLGNTGG